jgi:SAM-dependent methyltransferase
MKGFYQDNYRKYFASTVNVDPSIFLEPFVRHVSPKGEIFDVGCGSGRDLLWLRKRGINVTGLEQSPGLADLARRYAGCPVIEGDFHTYDFSSMRFDVLLCVGSLVHVP